MYIMHLLTYTVYLVGNLVASHLHALTTTFTLYVCFVHACISTLENQKGAIVTVQSITEYIVG